MYTRLLTSAGFLSLLAAAAAPSAAGHDERGSFGTSGGVSGHYIGAADTAIAAWPLDPVDSLGTGLMLCDAEVVQDDPSHPDNEAMVDGTLTGGTAGESWDDGGQGGACHTYHYSTPGFNTSGCQSGQAARGSNGADDIWVGASCDWKEDRGGASSATLLALCLASAAVGITPGNLLPRTLTLAQCALDFVACLLNPACGATGAMQICGADGASDAIDHGYGSGTVDPAVFPPNTDTVTNGNPPVVTVCPDAGVASIFVFDTVTVSETLLVEHHPAGTGELWTA